MNGRGHSILGIVNIGLAVGLVFTAIWLYGREHETRQVERQIRSLKRAIALEEEAIRRLEIEWQSLRNPMRLERLARVRLNLHAPDPLAVMPLEKALDMLPLRPARSVDEQGLDDREARTGLDDLAAQAAAEQAAEEARPANAQAMAETMPGARAPVVPSGAEDPLARLIRQGTGDGQ